MKSYLIFIVFTSILYIHCDPSTKSDNAVNPALIQAEIHFKTLCSSCHGERMQAFADRNWKHGTAKEDLYSSISVGFVDAGMPGWSATMSDKDINGLVDYILGGIEEVKKYGFQEERIESDTFYSESLAFTIDTVVHGLGVPWSMAFLPEGDMLVTERGGSLYRVNNRGEKMQIENVPQVRTKDQDGLHDILLHPEFSENHLLYLSYSALKVSGKDSLTTTKVSRFRLSGNKLSDEIVILEALPYTNRQYHFGSAMKFDREGYLYITVGDRGERTVNPQDLSLHAGKVHRVLDDGSIPENNPFVHNDTAVASIFSFGHRNPQGIDVHPITGKIWTHEHGPRGGDEINIIDAGVNYGWPVISYGINYDGTSFTQLLEKEGMKQPLHYWVPSIAPSGMAFINTDIYGDWKGHLLVGSLRFKYLNLCRIENDKVVSEEMLMKNIGRLRNVKIGPDGYIYIAVEKPGLIYRLRPLTSELPM